MKNSALTPRVTVFIPIYNSEKFLHETITGVLNQTYKNFELLAIDDGSTDSSLNILNSFNDPRIRIERNKKNMGRPYTRNRGVELAKGEYIAILDSDDIAMPDRLLEQVNFLDKNQDISGVGSFAEIISDTGKFIKTLELPCDTKSINSKIYQSNCFVHSSIMLRLQTLVDIGGYNLEYPQAQDYELFLRLCRNHSLANIPKVLVKYRIHSGQVSQTHISKQRHLADKARLSAFNNRNKPSNSLSPNLTFIHKLRGGESTLGADYLGWIDLYTIMGLNNQARKLIFPALLAAPFYGGLYRRLFRPATNSKVMNTLLWYKKKILQLINR